MRRWRVCRRVAVVEACCHSVTGRGGEGRLGTPLDTASCKHEPRGLPPALRADDNAVTINSRSRHQPLHEYST